MKEKLKMENINSWNEIEWSRIELRIFLLQFRIYKASKNKNWVKVHKLQTLMLRSKSAKLLAVKKAAQQNQSKSTPCVNKIFKLSPKEK